MRYRPKHTKQNKPHFSAWIMRIAATIGCLTIISAYLLSGVYAKFSTSASGSDSARVAKWDVSVEFTGTNTKFDLIDKDSQKTATYTFNVTSESEVALSYDIVITLPEALPDTVTFKIENVSPLKSEDGLIYTFADIGELTANGGTNHHNLEITSDFTHNSFRMEGIKVEVIAEQVD